MSHRTLIQTIDIRCENCQQWFPSAVYFTDAESFDASHLVGARQTCPLCDKSTGSNKGNFRVRTSEGGFLGDIAAGGGPTTPIENQTFENERLVLDGSSFTNCVFRNCQVVYYGTGPIKLHGNKFVDTQVLWGGPAAQTVAILAKMYHGGMKLVVETVIDQIRKGAVPTIPRK